jgi:predicted RecA/RadA family phage recombinase
LTKERIPHKKINTYKESLLYICKSKKTTMLKRLLLILTISISISVSAQLSPGSIAFVGIQTDAPDAFAFVALTTIPAGDTIHFTDNGWNGTDFFTTENVASWVNAVATPAGTVIKITDPDDGLILNGIVTGPGTCTGKLSGLSASGDQVIAWVRISGAKVPVAAISTNGWLPVCNTVAVGNSNYTCLPSNLTNGINAVAIGADSSDVENGYFNVVSLTGSVEEIRCAINNASNWTKNNDPLIAGAPLWPAWNFTFGPSNTSVFQFQSSVINLLEGGAEEIVTFEITPEAASAQTVTIQLGGAANSSDIITFPANVNGLLTLQIPAGSAFASFSISAVADGIVEGNEIGTITISTVSCGLSLGAQSVINYTISESSDPFVSFTAEQENTFLNEGAVVTINVNIAPAPINATTLQLVLSSISPDITFADFTTSAPISSFGAFDVPLAAGQGTYSFTITSTDDLLQELAESFAITIGDLPPDLLLGALDSITVVIVDNDSPIEAPVLFINEVMASNTSTIADENGYFGDWIEIYNPGVVAVDLAGMYISDDAATPNKYQFPTGSSATVIPAGGFKLIWADDSTQTGPLHANFKLSSTSGEFVGLYYQGAELFVVDSISFPPQTDNISFGRLEDGSSTWVVFSETTPNASNNTSGIKSILENEINLFPNPANEQITVSIPTFKTGTAISIYSIEGKLVKQVKMESNLTIVATNDLASGLYIVKLNNEKATVSKKLVVE